MHRFKARPPGWRRVAALRQRRTTKLALTAAGTAAALAMLIGSALAVHDHNFQLDGDTASSTTTSVANKTQLLDWNDFFNANTTKKSLPTDFTASGFQVDFNKKAPANTVFATNDTTTYATGSKDTLDISPGWQCTQSSNVNSKIDIMNAYAAAYTDPSTDHDILYFALERNANTGDGNVAFWFLQDEVTCVSPGGSTPFTGDHKDGDFLVVSAFTNGGGVSTIDAYRWTDPDPDDASEGFLETTPAGSGGDCQDANGGDEICATTNSEANGDGDVTTLWETSNKQDGVGHNLRQVEFFEGGIDLTATELSGKCFNTFIADTRSSQSLTATLFDYAGGTLGECSSSTVTTPQVSTDDSTYSSFPSGADANNAGSIEIPADATLRVKDSAVVTVTGVDTFSGELTFHLCGPLALNSTSTCDVDATTKAPKGVPVGSATTVTANGTYASDFATVTSVGRYCWRADFGGDEDAAVPPSADNAKTECFKVTPRTPSLPTTAGAGPVAFGQAVTDTAALSNTANKPGSGGLDPDETTNGTILTPSHGSAGGAAGGTISFTLYNASCTAVATGTGGPFPIDRTVTGNGTYPKTADGQSVVSFTPDAPGTYQWFAIYSGDSPNTAASAAFNAATCAADTAERVVVEQIPTKIKTDPFVYPQDTARIESTKASDPVPTGGTVKFRLFGPTGGGTPKTALQNCQDNGSETNVGTGGLLYIETKGNPIVAGDRAQDGSVTYTTSNTTVKLNPASSTRYVWRVTYATGNQAYTGRQSNCVEDTSVSVTNDAFDGTLFTP
jgi:hypothetical protein